MLYFPPEELKYDDIPINRYPTKFYEIELRGWSPITLHVEDENLNSIHEMSSFITGKFIGMYAETHQLSFQLALKINGDAIVKIATLEKPNEDEK